MSLDDRLAAANRLQETYDAARGRLEKAAAELGVLPQLSASLIRYACEGIATGDFLRAVLSNNFRDAIARADDESRANLQALNWFVQNFLGSACHGSAEAVDRWLAEPITREKLAVHG